jgi:type I restriction enzyme R subunit
MSNFAFLAVEFPAVHEAAVEAERQAGVSPTAAAFFAGKAVEVAVKWAFRSDPNLKLPYQDNIAALLHEPSFRRAAGDAVFAKARYINTLRNRAVHEEKTISPGDATGAVKELFHVCFCEGFRMTAHRDDSACTGGRRPKASSEGTRGR